MTWKFHEETRDKDPERDFAKLNKMSVTQGCFKSDQQSVFRKVVDARKSIPKGKNALPIYIPEEDFRYGIPNRPSTPIKLVIGNSYGYEGAIMKEDFYKQRAESLANTRHTLPRRNNKANALSYNYTRQKIQEIDSQGNKEYFKLSKFKAVKPRTNTFVKGHPNSKTLGGATSNREARKTQPMQQNQNQPNHQYVHDEDVPNEA